MRRRDSSAQLISWKLPSEFSFRSSCSNENDGNARLGFAGLDLVINGNIRLLDFRKEFLNARWSRQKARKKFLLPTLNSLGKRAVNIF